MTECERIAAQIERAWHGEPWHGGGAMAEILAGIDAELASLRKFPALHTIWEIAAHLAATQEILLRRLDGDETTLDLPEEVEWPPILDSSPAAWSELLQRLDTNDRKLQRRIVGFPDERLAQPLVTGGSSAYNNFHGYIEHNAWHAGQIVLLAKLGQ